LVEGGPVVLTSPDWRHRLEIGSDVAFAGEDPVQAQVASPALALNVITRRDRLHHSIERLRTGGSIDAPLTVILSQGWSLDGQRLDRFDAIEGPCTLGGGGEAVAIRFTPSH
jgi:environmental stress-induced protein Ves